MNENYLVYTKNGNKVFSKEEIINNALEQEKKGIKPHYAFYDYKKHKPITPSGWLVWSTDSGAGVVYRRKDGEMIIVTGWQGDFAYISEKDNPNNLKKTTKKQLERE